MKKAILFISVVMLFFTTYQIVDTYALFESNKDYNANSNLAKWIIDINDITIPSVNTFTIENISYDESEYVKENKIAPGICGYFDIEILASDIEVSLRYDIEIDKTIVEGTSFYIDKIEEINKNKLILSDKNVYTGTILLSDEDKNNLIRINICWQNNEENNEIDSTIGTSSDNQLNIPIKIKLLQYLNETIPTYKDNEE